MDRNLRACVILLAGLVAAGAVGRTASAGTDANGFFDEYLVLGPYAPGGDNAPAANMSLDYLCDGTVSEDDILPEEGLTLGVPDPGCAGAKADSRWAGPGVPTIQRIRTGVGDYPDSVNFDIHLSPNEQVMAYAWVYVENLTEKSLHYTLAIGSDDGVCVDVNRIQVWVISVSRGSGTGTIDDRVAVNLYPGGNLIQFKVFEGGGQWHLRARFEDENGFPVYSGGDILVGTDPIEVAGPAARGRRSVELLSATASSVVADVKIDVEATAAYSIEETFSDRYVASNPSPASAAIGAGSIRWSNLAPSVKTVSYRLTSAKPYSPQAARNSIQGTITAIGIDLPIGGTALIPPPAVKEVLVTPAMSSARGACTMSATDLAGRWIDDVSDGSITDQTIVPREGLEFLPAFGTGESQATRWAPIANEATFLTGRSSDPRTRGKLARIASTDGRFDWNALYGGDPNYCMNVAYFYVENATGENPLVAYMAVGSDEGILVRVNGRILWNNPVCRGYPGFADRFAIALDPGKNLIAIYTYEDAGEFCMGVQFQTREGNPIALPTTLDPAGYDPSPAKHPDHSALLATVPPTTPALSPLGFISEFLVPSYPFNRIGGDTAPSGARAEDYITIGDAIPDVSNTFEGAYAAPSLGGISMSVRSPSGCEATPLVRVTLTGEDKYFDGDAFYGGQDNYTSSVFAFLTNKTPQNQRIYMGFSSDDGAAIYLDGELVAEYGPQRGPGNANSIQNPGPVEVDVSPGTHLIQGSYIEVGGGSGIRIGLFEEVGVFSDGATVGPDWVPIDTADFLVSATNPKHATSVYATRRLPSISCTNTAKVALEFTVIGGGSAVVRLEEELPFGTTGLNPSQGSFDPSGTLLTFEGTVSTGQAVTYEIRNVTIGTAYCFATVNGEAVRGDSVFTRATDICTDVSKGYYINCGGDPLRDRRGRYWQADTIASPTKHLTGPNAYSATFTAQAPDLTLDPFVAGKEYPAAVFQVERWNDGPIEYTFTNVPPGCYEVALLFMEGCCSDGCNPNTADPRDPVENAGGCRVFNVTVNGQYPTNEDALNIHGKDGFLYSQKLAAGNRDYVATHLVSYVNVTGGEIVIRFEDFGSGNPPENASVKGIAIETAEDPRLCGGPAVQFRRADPDDSGSVNITDGIYILNYLFLGGPEPTCLESADPNDDGKVNITDGIYILNYLFLGGAEPLPPGAETCGPDPAGSADLGCASYTKC